MNANTAVAAAATALAGLGFNSVLMFKSDGKKADGSPLFYRLPKDGKTGVTAGYRIVVPGHDNAHGLGAKSRAASGLEYIEAYVALPGDEGEKAQYLNLRLFPNQKKTTDAHPVYRGFLETGNGDEAVRIADASGFLKTDKNGNPFLSVALQEPWVPESTDPSPAPAPDASKPASDFSDMDDLIPF